MSTQAYFYLTTAINYTNGSPHIGHAFEAILADVLAQYHRRTGPQVHFQTGTDEHGLKIAQTAEKAQVTPQELCDRYAHQFRALNQSLMVEPDFFIRTTDSSHAEVVTQIFRQLQEQDDIYLGEYEGWYNVREETYVTELEAQQTDFKDPITQKPLTKVREPSYFFRLSKYHTKIQEHLEQNPTFLVPESKRQAILQRLTKEPLKDLSISRTTFDWGIPVPGDPKHCLYVWLDALLNYYSGLQICGKPEFWPPNLQVIGKDIVWFHAVIWPGILLATHLELPKQIYVHDFIVADDGRKISKSLGNTIDLPHLLKTYPASTLRYYLLRECRYDGDLRFSEERLIQMHNSELADKLGNLTHRVLALPLKYTRKQVPSTVAQTDPPLWDLAVWLEQIRQLVTTFHFPDLLALINEKIHVLNQYLMDQTPWTIQNPKYPQDQRTKEEQELIIRTCLEGLYLISIVWEPISPSIAREIWLRLGVISTENITFEQLSWTNLVPGSTVTGGPVLFSKIKSRED